MDTAMRDLNQLRERGDEGTGRKLAVLALAAIVSGAAVFAMGILIGGGREAEADNAQDPLAQLDRAVGESPPPAAPAPAPVEVDAKDLSFPAALTTDPLVEAAVRAAAAEHAELSGHPSSAKDAPSARSNAASAPAATDTTHLTAGAAASGHGERLARVARHDPLVAAALPAVQSGERAEVGHPGKFTLQVVSYQSRHEADNFAEGLRGRGHRAYVMAADVPGRGRYYRVRIGPFEGRREALNYQRDFEADERMHTLVVRNPEAD